MAIFILEDNKLHSKYLSDLIKRESNAQHESLYIFHKPEELLNQIALTSGFHIYFLDIHLKNETEGGLLTAQKIRNLDTQGIIVFVSSHTDLALQSYKYFVNALTFINKNDALSNFKLSVKKCLDNYFANKNQFIEEEYLTIESKNSVFKVNLARIYYFESIGMHRIAMIGDQLYKNFYSSLNELETLHPNLVRIHRSFLVNRQAIIEVNRTNRTLLTKKQVELPISRKNLKTVLEQMG